MGDGAEEVSSAPMSQLRNFVMRAADAGNTERTRALRTGAC